MNEENRAIKKQPETPAQFLRKLMYKFSVTDHDICKNTSISWDSLQKIFQLEYKITRQWAIEISNFLSIDPNILIDQQLEWDKWFLAQHERKRDIVEKETFDFIDSPVYKLGAKYKRLGEMMMNGNTTVREISEFSVRTGINIIFTVEEDEG